MMKKREEEWRRKRKLEEKHMMQASSCQILKTRNRREQRNFHLRTRAIKSQFQSLV